MFRMVVAAYILEEAKLQLTKKMVKTSKIFASLQPAFSIVMGIALGK